MSSPAPSADRNLIFGLLALQMDFVSSEQLLDALHAWMRRKTTPIGEILRERGLLNERRLDLLQGMLDEHVAHHRGDAKASLAALRVEESVRENLHRLEDDDVQASLASLAPTPADTSAGKTPHGPASDSVACEATSAPTFAAPVGSRFRRLREHARGGLGEVFVALDEELNREVALKEIQERFADREDARTRFVREAEITGNLEHPGIVPVYGLGTYYDGRPYYAMRFIRGESMQDAIARFHENDERPGRNPSERSLALRELLGRFVAVCNAMAYAHNRGVIHRDLKPANIMLGEYGETLVVDWGLARLLDRPDCNQTTLERPLSSVSGSRTAQTQMGQVIGTATFMPPEQAEGRLDRMGLASDVFSLGATLYTVLTGEAPYQGADLLGQARRAEVKPARQRKPSVPAALEAVCGKAMAKRPEDRYPSALALAEEVQRWLADESVQAYPEPLAERFRRWGRHNRGKMSAGVVLLLAVVVGLSAGLWAVGREQRRTKEAARLAEEQKERAEQAEKETLEHFRASTDDVVEQLIGSKPVLGPQEKRYLQRTLQAWQEFAGRAGDDERSRAIRAEGHFRVALLQHSLGQTDDAIAGFREALAIQEKLSEDFPDVAEHRKTLAQTHLNLGALLKRKNQWDRSAEHYHAALAIQGKLVKDFPADGEYRDGLAAVQTNLGALSAAQNKWDEAAEHYREALSVQQRLAEEFPDIHAYRKRLAGTHNNLALLREKQNLRAKAAEHHNQALAIRQKLAEQLRDVPEHRRDLAQSHANLGVLLAGQNQPEQSALHYRKALALQQELAEEFPATASYRENLADTHHNLATLLEHQQEWKESARQHYKALALRQKLADEYPTVPGYRHALAGTHNNLGALLAGQNQEEKAVEHYQQALDIWQKLADKYPGVPEYRRELAGTHGNLGLLLHIQNQWPRAAEQLGKSLAIREKLVEEFPRVPLYQLDLGGAYGNYGRTLRHSGKPAESLPWFEKAIRTLTTLHQQDPLAIQPRLFLRNGHASRAAALAQLGKHAEAIKDWNLAVELSSPRDRPRVRVERANSLVRAGQAAEAVSEVVVLTRGGKWSADKWYDLACVCAVAADKDPARKKDHADRAMDLLDRAVKAGYRDAAHAAKDRDLNALRDREDFKKWLEALGKARKTVPRKAG